MASNVGQAFSVPEGDQYIFLLRNVQYNTRDKILHRYHTRAIDIQQQLQPIQSSTTPSSNYKNRTRMGRYSGEYSLRLLRSNYRNCTRKGALLGRVQSLTA